MRNAQVGEQNIVMYLLVKVGQLWLRRSFLPSNILYVYVITSATGYTQAPVIRPQLTLTDPDA